MATNPFGGLGLSNVGNESKYFGQPVDMPGWLQGVINVPKAYAAQKFIKPAGAWLENKLSPVPPPAEVPVGMPPVPSQASITVALPADAEHPELQNILAVDPYAQIKP